jgi:1-phosphofructokinase family hexose kinase
MREIGSFEEAGRAQFFPRSRYTGGMERPADSIVTVTLNPAIDELISVDVLQPGETNRCAFGALDPGGKGINASRVIARLGGATIAYGFTGGVTGAMLERALDDEGVWHDFDRIDGLTRLNVMLFDRRTKRRTRLLLDGPSIGQRELASLRARLAALPSGSTVVLGGSVPPGVPTTIYRELVSSLNARSIRCVVDTSGEPLVQVLESRPALIKPNVEEASAAVGRPLIGDDEILRAAVELRARGAQSVVISRGADGAIGVSSDGAWKALAPVVDVKSTIGSGDSMVGAMALALVRGSTFGEMLRFGIAAGTATAMAPDRNLCRVDDVEPLLPRVVLIEEEQPSDRGGRDARSDAVGTAG